MSEWLNTRGVNKYREGTELTIDSFTKIQPYTAGHQIRVKRLCSAIGQEMELEPDIVKNLEIGALVHDIGKLHIPLEIVNNPQRLNDLEWDIMKKHPLLGCEILRSLNFPSRICQIVLQHHERLDGSGYPLGLFSHEILIESKIVAVADVVDALSSQRKYYQIEDGVSALEEITNHRGSLYDETVVDICLMLFREKDFQLEPYF